jgi:hypothetical protein
MSGKYPEVANVEACESYFGALDVMREKYLNWDQDYSQQRSSRSCILSLSTNSF